MPVNRNQIKPALIEIILVVTLLNSFAIFKLYKKIDSLAVYTAALSSQSAPAPTVDVSIDDDEFVGDPNAPVTIVEFTDFECKVCSMHYQQIYPQIHQKYVETGLVRYVVRDYPIEFHLQAQKAAEAAECAGEQGNYWEMHYMLFENQANLSVDNYKKWAREIGLDGAIFDECLDSGAMEEEVKMDVADGSSYGVHGTPIFFINGKMISGAKPFAVFDAAIQKALEE